MGAYLKVGDYSRGRLFNNFSSRPGAYSRGALIRGGRLYEGGANSRHYGIRLGENTSEGDCCKLDMKSSEMDLERVETYFEETSNLNTTENSTLYNIAGYITHKENLESTDPSEIELPPSEFTTYLSCGSLSHPPADLFNLSLHTVKVPVCDH